MAATVLTMLPMVLRFFAAPRSDGARHRYAMRGLTG